MADAQIPLIDSQLQQCRTFLEEKDHSGSLILRPALTLGEGYVEVILLDADGEPTPRSESSFPNEEAP
jgi:hypothetical protein